MEDDDSVEYAAAKVRWLPVLPVTQKHWNNFLFIFTLETNFQFCFLNKDEQQRHLTELNPECFHDDEQQRQKLFIDAGQILSVKQSSTNRFILQISVLGFSIAVLQATGQTKWFHSTKYLLRR